MYEWTVKSSTNLIKRIPLEVMGVAKRRWRLLFTIRMRAKMPHRIRTPFWRSNVFVFACCRVQGWKEIFRSTEMRSTAQAIAFGWLAGCKVCIQVSVASFLYTMRSQWRSFSQTTTMTETGKHNTRMQSDSFSRTVYAPNATAFWQVKMSWTIERAYYMKDDSSEHGK